MAGFIRTVTKKVFIITTIVVSAVFLLSCLVAYLNPARWWPVGFLGLSVPYLVLVLIFLLIFWLIVRAKYALIPFVALAVGYQQLAVLFAWNLHAGFDKRKKAGDIRVVSWNIRNFVALSNNPERRKHNREQVADAILKQNADIVCLQEFNHSLTKGAPADNLSLFREKYPYHFFSKDISQNGGAYQYGSVIFSRHPIVDSGRVPYPGVESLAWADVVLNSDTVRVFTTHLQSFRFNNKDYSDMQKIRAQDEETLNASRSLVRKMKLAFTRRGQQAEIVRSALNASPHPQIMTGDFNDVPNSFTYFHIKGAFTDAFLAKGFGVGRTFIALAPTLRIDYILAHPVFTVRQFDMVDEDLSDHIMLVSDLSLKK